MKKRVNTFCFQEFRHTDWLDIQKNSLWHEDMFRLDDYLFISVRLVTYKMEQYYGISYDYVNECKQYKFCNGTGFWIHGYAKNIVFYSQFNYALKKQFNKNDLCKACGMKPCVNYIK